MQINPSRLMCSNWLLFALFVVDQIDSYPSLSGAHIFTSLSNFHFKMVIVGSFAPGTRKVWCWNCSKRPFEKLWPMPSSTRLFHFLICLCGHKTFGGKYGPNFAIPVVQLEWKQSVKIYLQTKKGNLCLAHRILAPMAAVAHVQRRIVDFQRGHRLAS